MSLSATSDGAKTKGVGLRRHGRDRCGESQRASRMLVFLFLFSFVIFRSYSGNMTPSLRLPLLFIYNSSYTIWEGKLVSEISLDFEVKFGLKFQFKNLADVENFLEKNNY